MKDFKLNRLIISTSALGCAWSFTSCSNDDPSPIPGIVTTESMFGNYTGSLSILSVAPGISALTDESGEPEGTTATATIDNDTIYFKDFPIKDLVMAVVGDETTADQIVAAVGPVNYNVGYEPALTPAQDSIYFDMKPEPLQLTLTLPAAAEGEEAASMNIQVNIVGAEGASYEVATSALNFQLGADEVSLGTGEDLQPLPGFNPLTLNFEMNKSKE